jgi:hypothetical protein
MLQNYAAFLGRATHEYILDESLRRVFRRDKQLNIWLEKNRSSSAGDSLGLQHVNATGKSTVRTVPA